MFEKPSTVVDINIRREIKKQSCICCDRTPVDAAHIHSKGAGGPYTRWNIIPLCSTCHRMQHDLGWSRMFQLYPMMGLYLQSMGWYWLDGKLWNDKLVKK